MKQVFLLAGLAAIFITACGAAGTEVHLINAEEAKTMMDAGGVVVVDVRTPEEYRDGHVPEAVNIPNEEIGTEEIALLPDKSQVLLVYCRSGRRSAEASDKLLKLGYEEVYDFGGIQDWSYEIEK